MSDLCIDDRTNRRGCRLLAIALPALVLWLSACGGNEAAIADSPQMAESSTYLVESPTTQLGVCVDSSPSMDPAVITAVAASLPALRDAVPDPPDLVEGREYPGATGLHVVIRRVAAGTRLADQLVNIAISAVPQLLPRPSESTDLDSYTTELDDWGVAAETTGRAHTAAGAERQGLSKLDSIVFEGDGSEIIGCITALAESFDQTVPMTLLLVTDLQQRGAPDARYSLGSAALHVIHSCQPPKDACDGQRSQFAEVTSAMGLPPDALTFHDPARFSQVIDQIVAP